MDVITTPPYEEMQKIFRNNFHLPNFGSDCSEKFALISLICYITEKLKQKNPDVTHWKVLYNLNMKGNCHVETDWLKGLAVVCSEFAYGCTTFPTFGLTDKEIPKKIIEMLQKWLPF